MTGQTGTWQAPPPNGPARLASRRRPLRCRPVGGLAYGLPARHRPTGPTQDRQRGTAPHHRARRTIHTDQEVTTVGSYFEIAEPHPDEQHQPRRTNTHIVTVGQKDDYDLRTDRDAAEYRIVRAYSER